MTFANETKDYEAKLKRMHDVCQLKEPDQVPLFLFNAGWGLAYSNTQLKDVLTKPQEMNNAMLKFLEDIYTDFMAGNAVAAQIDFLGVMGAKYPTYKITADGLGFEHHQASETYGGMTEDDYALLIKDIKKYVLNVLAPRRFEALNKPYPENYEAMKRGYDSSMTYLNSLVIGDEIAKNTYGVPLLGNGACFAPIDFIFDFLRGMVGIMKDIRRKPEEVLQACDTVKEYEEDLFLSNTAPGAVVRMPLHLAPYMNKKQFEKFYWPSFKNIVQTILDKGAQAMVVLEGDWTPHMEYLTEFPKGSLIANIEYADFAEVKKKYGSYFSIQGGLDCGVLKYSTKEECINFTKKLLDTCAPGGGFTVCPDKALTYAGDLNIENYQAVIDTVREYGKY